MRATLALLNNACRLTLFTRANCSLCEDAKSILARVRARKPFEYREINVMDEEAKAWRNVYEFDTPVVGDLYS